MQDLLIDHNYRLGIAWDRSKYRNHGIPYEAPPGTGYFGGSLSFEPNRTHPGSAIVVPPSKSTERIGSIRVRAVIHSTPLGGGGKRQNIVEGDHSFAFFVNPNFSIQGTFLSPGGTWDGIRSAPMAVMPNRTHEVEYSYDGVSRAEIKVDGNPVASSSNASNLIGPPMVGPVRGVGPYGVFIGHWPAQDDRYTFHGYIWEVQVWRRDDVKDLLEMLDPCCLRDMSKIFEAGMHLKKRGHSLKEAYTLLDQLAEMGARMGAEVRGDTAQQADNYDWILSQFMTAVSSGGQKPVGPVLKELAKHFMSTTTKAQMDGYAREAEEFINGLPLSRDEILGLGKEFCMNRLVEELEREKEYSENDPEWKKLREEYANRRR